MLPAMRTKIETGKTKKDFVIRKETIKSLIKEIEKSKIMRKKCIRKKEHIKSVGERET